MYLKVSHCGGQTTPGPIDVLYPVPEQLSLSGIYKLRQYTQFNLLLSLLYIEETELLLSA